ncbi:MAG: SDR family NAD(P)-dependent oxidoreductase [Janthinobacterium lividum]
MSDLRGAAFLVTGASGGLGHLLAQRLADRGARLVVSARDVARLDGVPGHPVAADLSAAGEPERLVAAAVAHLGGLDGLVHAAGAVAFGAVGDTDDDLLDDVFLLDAIGPIRLLRSALDPLRRAAAERGSAVAVLLTGVVAEQPQPGMAAYCAAKAALSAFAAATAREVRREKVRVLDVRPPHTETGLATRPLAGTAPRLPPGLSPDTVADRIVAAIVDDERDLPASAFG